MRFTFFNSTYFCLMPRECFGMSDHAELSALYTSLRGSSGTPQGVQAISRGLSVATPPDYKPNTISTPKGSQFVLRDLGCQQAKSDNVIFFKIPPRNIRLWLRPLQGRWWYPILSGGVATLNPRLKAYNPTGCNRSTSAHWRIAAEVQRGNDEGCA